MCKGLGKMEKKIISCLDVECSTSELIKNMFGRSASEAQKQSVWRALRNLEQKNIIQSKKNNFWSNRPHHTHGGQSFSKVISLVQDENGKFAKNTFN